MESSTWGRSVRLPDRLKVQSEADAQGREEGDEDDLQLEQWHQSHLADACYLAIFVVVATLTLLAFVPVWLLLQAQRMGDLLRGLWTTLREDRHRQGRR